MNFKKSLLPLLVAGVLLGGTGCTWVSSDTRAMRDVALEHLGSGTEKTIDLSLGRLTCAAVRVGSGFIKNIPEEARTIVGAIHGGDVSVYKVRQGREAANYAEILAEADKEMTDRGWTRLVGVVNKHELVAVYVGEKSRWSNTTRASVMVLSDHDLVCVSARADIETLMDLALHKAHDQIALR